MLMMFEQIKIELVATSHPGNIGSCARAMKTMGLKHLVLVQPKSFPSPDASALASGAEDILAAASIYEHLQDAIADCHWVIGTTARPRDLSWPMYAPEMMAVEAKQRLAEGQKIALVFGRESSGLSNEELWLCHAGLTIPTSAEYRSLNLSQAVQIIAYELFKQLGDFAIPELASEQVTVLALENFFIHLQTVLIEIGFMSAEEPKRLMPKLKRLFHRAKIQVSEMNILRGILTSIQQGRRPDGD
jgi:tRNA (cytidine32/uridine32-2'-O)-methyltransferase